MKKVLALVLALATVLSLGVTAFAADVDIEDQDFASVYLKDAYTADFGGWTKATNALDVVPDKTLYYVLDKVEIAENTLAAAHDKIEVTPAELADGDLFKVKFDKENSKYIKSIKLVEKDVGGAAGRENVIEVKLNDDQTDNEYKIQFTASFTAKGKYMDTLAAGLKDFEIFFKEQTIWMGNNKVEEEDYDTTAGTGGIFVKPVKNEENTITWEDENNTLAVLTADMDSSTQYYFPKLSTKWDNVKYAELFNDQDAFVRQWVGTPEISSTSRAVLELNVPYIDDDDELTVDEDSIIVYEETADGELIDITSKGTFGYNDDDEFVFTMKTRRLGTYIFAEAPVTEAEDEVPADEVVGADKVNPGTGF